MNSELALKPCPFCGGAAKVSISRDDIVNIRCENWGQSCMGAGQNIDSGGDAIEQAAKAWNTRAALSTEAQPEVTGAVAIVRVGQNDFGPFDFEVTPYGCDKLPDGETKLYPPSAIEAAVNAKSEALKERDRLGYAVVQLVEAVDALLEAGSDEYLHDENGDFTYEEAPSDYWADLRTAADNMVLRAEDFEEKYRAIAAPQPSAIQAAVREKLEEAAALVIRQIGVEHGEILADEIRALMGPKS